MSHNIQDNALDAFRDHFKDVLDVDGTLNEDAHLSRYWEDDLIDLADRLVPIYTSDLIEEWTEDGYLPVDDTGLLGDTDGNPITLIQIALYERYHAELRQAAEDAGFYS